MYRRTLVQTGNAEDMPGWNESPEVEEQRNAESMRLTGWFHKEDNKMTAYERFESRSDRRMKDSRSPMPARDIIGDLPPRGQERANAALEAAATRHDVPADNLKDVAGRAPLKMQQWFDDARNKALYTRDDGSKVLEFNLPANIEKLPVAYRIDARLAWKICQRCMNGRFMNVAQFVPRNRPSFSGSSPEAV